VEQGAALAQQVASLSLGQGDGAGRIEHTTSDSLFGSKPINFAPPANNTRSRIAHNCYRAKLRGP